jgi:hypothetical protein
LAVFYGEVLGRIPGGNKEHRDNGLAVARKGQSVDFLLQHPRQRHPLSSANPQLGFADEQRNL